jgi:hypothetical protein
MKDSSKQRYSDLKMKWEPITPRQVISRYFGIPRCRKDACYLHIYSYFSYFGHGGSNADHWVAIPEFQDSVDALSFLRFWMIPHMLEYTIDNIGVDEVVQIDKYFSGYTQGGQYGKGVKMLLDAMDSALANQDCSALANGIYSQINKIFGEHDPSLSVIASGRLLDILNARYEICGNAIGLHDAIAQYVEWDSTLAEKLQALLTSATFEATNRKHIGLARDFFTEYLDQNRVAPPWYLSVYWEKKRVRPRKRG